MARYVPDPAQRVTVFLGEAGCGKSELAVQWALTAAERRRDVHFYDLDRQSHCCGQGTRRPFWRARG